MLHERLANSDDRGRTNEEEDSFESNAVLSNKKKKRIKQQQKFTAADPKTQKFIFCH